MDLFPGLIFTALSLLKLTSAIEDWDTSSLSQSVESNETRSSILSRRKRFLVFNEGSSVQIVFETQNHGYMQVGDIVWFSETAALAWELPTDPEIYLFFKKGNKEFQAKRRQDTKHYIYYLDDKGKVLDKVKYEKKKFIIPVFGKRSLDGQETKEMMTKEKIKEMHENHKRIYFNQPFVVKNSSVNFHRKKQSDLYEKVEMYLENLGWKGRDCVLRMLCESGKGKSNQGSFVEEILRSVFTLPNGSKFEDKKHQEYDEAHNNCGDCITLYPDCTPNDIGPPQQFLINDGPTSQFI